MLTKLVKHPLGLACMKDIGCRPSLPCVHKGHLVDLVRCTSIPFVSKFSESCRHHGYAYVMDSCVGLQSCDGVIWNRIMQQFSSLGVQPGSLPEEALTQIYQASPHSLTTSQCTMSWQHNTVTKQSASPCCKSVGCLCRALQEQSACMFDTKYRVTKRGIER